MKLIDHNVTQVDIDEKKSKNNQTGDLSYRTAARIVEEKLSCVQHSGSNHWCYINPETPVEHIALGREEVSLWARKIVSILPDTIFTSGSEKLTVISISMVATLIQIAADLLIAFVLIAHPSQQMMLRIT